MGHLDKKTEKFDRNISFRLWLCEMKENQNVEAFELYFLPLQNDVGHLDKKTEKFGFLKLPLKKNPESLCVIIGWKSRSVDE